MKNPRPTGVRLVSTLRPISYDRSTALDLARRAIQARNEPARETVPFLSAIERDVADGSAAGVLRLRGDRVVGIALWDPPSAIGLTIEVLFLVPGFQTPDTYREFYAEIGAAAGPVALAPGLLAGLSTDEEERVMRGLGFARFARSEMRLPPDAPVPAPVPGTGPRAVLPGDETALAHLHALAYRDHLDRFLFFSDPDPGRDAEIQVRDIVRGRWGEFLPWASFVVAADGRVVAATLVVRAAYGPLVADVMVDPSLQGRGLGRAVVVATIRALRDRNESEIVLNVTDGNERALRLYERVGFVRTLGPSHGWYSTDRIRLPSVPG